MARVIDWYPSAAHDLLVVCREGRDTCQADQLEDLPITTASISSSARRGSCGQPGGFCDVRPEFCECKPSSCCWMAGNNKDSTPNPLRTECCNVQSSASCCGCFPGDSVVVTEAGGQRRISQLAIGDRVLSARPDGSTFFNDVYLFGHKDAAVMTSFMKLQMASGAVLRLTGDHHVPVRRAGAAPHCSGPARTTLR